MPLRAVEAVLVRANRVLILQRTSGTWQFVTGGMKDKETEEQALLREIREETGLEDVRVVGKMGTRLISIDNKQIGISSFLVMSNSVAVDVSHNPDAEHLDYKWVRLDEAHKHLQHDDQIALVKKAEKMLGDVFSGDD